MRDYPSSMNARLQETDFDRLESIVLGGPRGERLKTCWISTEIRFIASARIA
jgi:hypothetical protein